MRDGNVPRFFVRQKRGRADPAGGAVSGTSLRTQLTQLIPAFLGRKGGPSWWGSWWDQLADPANPANPSFSEKVLEERRKREGRMGERREGEGEGGVIC